MGGIGARSLGAGDRQKRRSPSGWRRLGGTGGVPAPQPGRPRDFQLPQARYVVNRPTG
jgi:hypothetical protein